MTSPGQHKHRNDQREDGIENDPRFLKRIQKARANLRAGNGIPWKDIEEEAE